MEKDFLFSFANILVEHNVTRSDFKMYSFWTFYVIRPTWVCVTNQYLNASFHQYAGYVSAWREMKMISEKHQ